ncbi:MAG: hypothetical protein ACI868_001013, partial [Granulosicoccus sp.]
HGRSVFQSPVTVRAQIAIWLTPFTGPSKAPAGRRLTTPAHRFGMRYKKPIWPLSMFDDTLV